MNILAANAHDGWKRPIYFNGSYPNREDILGLSPYMRMEGIVYHLQPFTREDFNTDTKEVNNIDVTKSVANFTKLYIYGGASQKDVYFDEKNRVMLMAYRLNSIQLADRLSALNRKQDAVHLLDKMLENITEQAYPHDQLSLYMVSAYYHADAFDKAKALSQKLIVDTQQDIQWINDLPESSRESELGDLKRDESMLKQLALLRDAAKNVLQQDGSVKIENGLK